MDQGSFYLADHGEIFLEERYDGEHHYYDDPVYRTHAIQPISHNTILIDRNPQSQKAGDPAVFAPGMNDQARFESWVDSESFSFVRGSLDGVYKGTVKELRRNVLYIKPRTILLVDEIIPGEKDVEANLLFHTTWKKDISIEDDFVRFQKGPSSLFLFPCSPQDTVKNIREKPHFLYQYSTQPLITRGYLELSAKTSGKKLVAANLLTATADGRLPQVKVVREKDRVLIETAIDHKNGVSSVGPEINGNKAEIVVNTGTGVALGEYTTDGLILAKDDAGSVFMASGTYINKGSLTILRSDKPITANMKFHREGIDISCHPSTAPALLTVSCVRKPEQVLVDHKSAWSDTYDSKSRSLKLAVPSGEGTIKLLLFKEIPRHHRKKIPSPVTGEGWGEGEWDDSPPLLSSLPPGARRKKSPPRH